ncbi:MAG: GNAT family N-acetyltransferase [candidate division NC10 bacterium]|nr:GNAT family N-acetyltransferase [candidate division NC10 bacterium]MBI3086653.1 GNAT family N-acetyltransferase [candidate division NC10 bacterium]
MPAAFDLFDPRPITLEGVHVRLEPLARRHAADLYEVGRDETIWRYMPRPPLKSLEDTQGWIDEVLAVSAGGTQIPFAIIERASNRAVGSTRYLDIRRSDRGLEIGWTWIGLPFQRTAVNTECKYLLLAHAFEDQHAVRVQLKTDLRNEASQRGIERLGAVREGVLRKHIVLWDGFIRDTVYYSIIDSEWSTVKCHLERLLVREDGV